MSVFDRLREGIFRVRVVPQPDAKDKTTITREKDTVPNRINEAIEQGRRIDLTELLNITTLKGNRNEKYKAFEEMVADGRIGAAVEMYANDAVQYNSQGKIIWVESDSNDAAKYGNTLLEDLNVADNIWSWAYCLCLYGDVYLETFMDTSNSGTKPTLLLEPIKQNINVRTQKDIPGAKLLRYIEKVPNPADIYDLQLRGKTSGYIRSNSEIENELTNNTYTYTYTASTELDVLGPTKFVHICLSPNINRFPEKFRLIKKTEQEKELGNGEIDASDLEGTGDSLTFTVKTGQSILENVYGAYQTLKLKEESVLLERITKSSITRVIQVELGDMPESQKRKKLQLIKDQIEQQLELNKSAGTIQSRAGAQPIENIIYTSTKDGKGAISTVNIGGDVDIGNLDDVNQSENKVYGALLIPKALLGADMDGSGLSNGGSLTEMNTTYARRIKRIQIALQTGIETLLNIFALAEGLKQHVGKFSVKLTPIITVEDNRRDELLQNKIRNVNDMVSLVDGIEKVDEDTKLQMLIEWLSRYLNQQDIVDIIDKHLKELDKEETEKTQDEHEKQIDSGTTFSGANPTLDTDFDGPVGDIENNMDTDIDTDTQEETNTEPPELADQQNLADIEGEDLV